MGGESDRFRSARLVRQQDGPWSVRPGLTGVVARPGERLGDAYDDWLGEELRLLGLTREDLERWRPPKKTGRKKKSRSKKATAKKAAAQQANDNPTDD